MKTEHPDQEQINKLLKQLRESLEQSAEFRVEHTTKERDYQTREAYKIVIARQ